MSETINSTELSLLKRILDDKEQLDKKLEELNTIAKGNQQALDYFLSVITQNYKLSPDDKLTPDGYILRNNQPEEEVPANNYRNDYPAVAVASEVV
jgi:hypothetical protein